jgi:hypothetical protein
MQKLVAEAEGSLGTSVIGTAQDISTVKTTTEKTSLCVVVICKVLPRVQ